MAIAATINDDRPLNNEEIGKLVESMEKEVEKFRSLQSIYDIFQVPSQVHKLKPEAYTPQSLSIGPLHYNEEHLQAMQAHKFRYLYNLLNRQSGKTLDVYVEGVSILEEKARKCYSEVVGLEKEEFVKMMVVDGCFILEFLNIITLKEDDHFFSNQLWFWEIMYDLIKLENQHPFFVLEHLHGLIFDHHHESLPSDQSSTCSHHTYVWLLDYYASGLQDPTFEIVEQIGSLPLPEGGPKHFLDLLRFVLLPSSLRTIEHDSKQYLPLRYCASKLRSAAVKFQKEVSHDSSKTSLFEFDVNKGVLTIPTIMIMDMT